MSRRTAARLSWTLVLVSVVVAFTGSGLKIAVQGALSWHFAANDVIPITIFLVSGVVGALVASRLPENPIGWIFLGVSVLLGLSGAADGYAVRRIDHGDLSGLAAWAAWYSAYAYVFFFAEIVFVLLLFPDGRTLSPRWRILVWAGGTGLSIYTVGVVLQPGQLDQYPSVTNPAGVDSSLVGWLWAPGLVLFLVAAAGAAVSVVLRFRRARGVERQQLTWLAVAGVMAASSLPLGFIVGSVFSSGDALVATVLLGVLAIPIAIGFAILRYRLYDIGRVVNRSLVYASLTVVLGAAYAGLVLLGQAVSSSFAGGSNLAIAVSTLVVAALFLPVRSRVQRLVDRRFYRRRYDALRTLETFGMRLREQVELEGLRHDLVAVVGETMQPAHASLWLRGSAAP